MAQQDKEGERKRRGVLAVLGAAYLHLKRYSNDHKSKQFPECPLQCLDSDTSQTGRADCVSKSYPMM